MKLLTITATEAALARRIGAARYANAVRGNMRDTLGKNSRVNHMLGAMGEVIVARSIGVPMSEELDVFKKRADVGVWDVRTRRGARSRLIIRPEDPDRRVVLVCFLGGDAFTTVGCMQVADAKREEWWKPEPPHPAWFVPQRYLSPFAP